MVLGIAGSNPAVRRSFLLWYWLFLDNILLLSIIFIHLLIFIFIMGRSNLLRSVGTTGASVLIKTKHQNLYFNYFILNKIIIYYIILVLFLSLITTCYTCTFLINYTLYQLQFNHLSWYFMIFLHLISLIFLFLISCRLTYIYWTFELTFIITILFTILLFYTLVNNIFNLIFFLELQGLTFIYFAMAGQAGSLNNKLCAGRAETQQNHLWILNSLFAQFWASFVGTILLIYAAGRLSYLYGSISWFDLNLLYYFSLLTLYSYLNYTNLIIIILLVAGIWIKLGIFPYYFWKPELYNNLTWETLLWYVSSYSFAFIFLFITLFTQYLYIWTLNLYFILWLLIIGGFILLPSVLFVINDIKNFIVYMSVFHILFMAACLINNFYYNIVCAYTYLVIYTSVILFFFCILFIFTPLSLKYLTDISIFGSHNFILFSLICSLAAMGGVPPLLGFWAKISVINLLFTNSEFILALAALGCGLFLLYFYLQNYRFISALHFNFNYKNYIYKINNSLYVGICLFTLVNIWSIFFIYDIWNIFNLIIEICYFN